jgi:uncharacterized membrane protein YebE (DUF533 family)
MFDAKRLLFGLLRSQMTGSRSHRVQRGFGGSTLGGRGGGLLGSLAITALQSYMERQRSPASPAATTPPAESALIEEDEVAQILVQVMIAAARADGEITAAERQRILDELTQAGADEEERLFLQRELDKPLDLDAVLSRIRDHQMEEEAYTVAACHRS